MSGGDEFRAEIDRRAGLVGEDSIMNQITNPPSRGHHGPASVGRIIVDDIEMGPRKREPMTADVNALRADIEQIGLLQPIGVRRHPTRPGKYILMWGANRLSAYQDGWGAAQKMLAERGVQDEEAFRQAKMWQQIPAIIFHQEIPAELVERREISENLIRTELTPEMRSIQRMRYVELVAKQGRVASAGQVRNANKEATVTRQPHDAADGKKLETVTSIASRELSVSKDTLQREAKRVEAMANAAARASGQEPVTGLTPESDPAKLERARKLAEKTERIIRAEKQAGRNTRRIAPIDPAGATVIVVRIDITDPT